MEATAYGNKSWLVADMFQELMLSPAVTATSSLPVDSSSSNQQSSSEYSRYWESLLQLLQQVDSLDDAAFPALPENHVHPVFWRLTAVALHKTIHIIDASDAQPKMMVYPPIEGMRCVRSVFLVLQCCKLHSVTVTGITLLFVSADWLLHCTHSTCVHR